jgi:hypothetical protein
MATVKAVAILLSVPNSGQLPFAFIKCCRQYPASLPRGHFPWRPHQRRPLPTAVRTGAGTIEPRGQGRWVVRVSFGRDPLNGKRIREAVTVSGTHRDAELELRRLLVAREGSQGAKQVRSRLTVGARMDEFVRTDPEASEPTRRRMQQSWRLYAGARLRAWLLRDLSPALLTAELARLRPHTSPGTKKLLAGRTVGIFYAILRAGLAHAVQQGIIATNPARALRRPTDETKSPQAPT